MSIDWSLNEAKKTIKIKKLSKMECEHDLRARDFIVSNRPLIYCHEICA